MGKIAAAVKVLKSGDMRFFFKMLRKNLYASWDMELLELERKDVGKVLQGGSVHLRLGTTDDVDAITRIWPAFFMPAGSAQAAPDQIVRDHMRESLACYVAQDEGGIVSVLFTKDASKWSGQPAIEFAKGATAESARGQSVLGRLLQYAAAAVKDGERLFTQIMPSNKAALRAAQKAGFRRIGILRTTLIAGVTRYRIIPMNDSDSMGGVC